jgi:hypothetical protein
MGVCDRCNGAGSGDEADALELAVSKVVIVLTALAPDSGGTSRFFGGLALACVIANSHSPGVHAPNERLTTN